ncbi:MAG: M3 family oligoendopeptidase [candidate division Zixibacteria bacterium]|nr:M3 family oligoendopeptidase [candidate division Zixibacteria bacterium]
MSWDLDTIFPGGSESAEFESFRMTIDADLEAAEESLAGLPRKTDDTAFDKWAEFCATMQNLGERIIHGEEFSYCLTAQDIDDEKAAALLDEMISRAGSWQSIMTGVDEFILGLDDDSWAILVGHEKLSGTMFYWNERRFNARHRMEAKLEKLAAGLSGDGYHAWARLYEHIAGGLKVEFISDGKSETLSMGQLHNKFSSADRDIREQAFEKLESAWGSVESQAAMILNSQAGFRLKLYKARGWESPLLEPLMIGRLKQETLDAMWSAVARAGKSMADYISAKKKLLGIENFRWYDQRAPISKIDKSVSYEEACDFVIKYLTEFSPDMGKLARTAIDDRWIEAEDRSGKAAGGFQAELFVSKQSRIFMTFSGDYDQMMTLAHELGHAYHSYVMRDLDYFSQLYSMNLAETASTFNELLVTDAAMADTDDPSEKLWLLDRKIEEAFGHFCDLRSRFLFDKAFYEERKKGILSRKRLCELMVESQKIAFGDILSEDGYHPLFWAAKSHFFDTESPFYNFPYVFGYLFSGGIYEQARREGSSFADKYKALLLDTGSMTCEEVAKKHLGVDLTTEQFWNQSVDRVIADIDQFVKLSQQV